ncbi:MAG: hypothetical protein AAGG00_17810 [Cyanobacteria bacterium P01_H01_bin.150]
MKISTLVFLGSIAILITGCIGYDAFSKPRPDEYFNGDETVSPTPIATTPAQTPGKSN